MQSISRTLLIWILGALSLGALLVALVTYIVTLEEMNEVFDGELRNVAEAVASYHHAGHHEEGEAPLGLPVRTDVPDETEIVTMTWTARGERVYSSDPRVSLPFSTTEGLARPVVDGEEWIVYSSVRPARGAQAALRGGARKAVAPYEAAGKLRRFSPGQVLPAGVTALDSHGHTPGHVSWKLDTGNGPSLLVWGDIVHFHAVQFAHPQAAYEADSDRTAAVASRRAMMAQAADGGWWVAGAHLPFPGLGHVRREGEAFAWVPGEFAPLPGR